EAPSEPENNDLESTCPGRAAGRLSSTCSKVRAPMLTMSCLLITCTGDAVSTSVRRMLEPVTSMRDSSVVLSFSFSFSALLCANAGAATANNTLATANDSGAGKQRLALRLAGNIGFSPGKGTQKTTV